MHNTRRFCVGPADSPEDLARKLTAQTWTLYTGFYVRGHEDYLFFNDSTHEDAACEIAIVKGGLDAETHLQIESITFGWCDQTSALKHIQEALAGNYDHSDFARPVKPKLDPADRHGRCPLCA